LVVFYDALDDTSANDRLARQLCRLVRGQNNLGVQAPGLLKVNLRVASNVDAFRQLFRFFSSFAIWTSNFHLQAAGIMGIVSICYATMTVVLTGFVGVRAQVWTVSSQVDGVAALAVVLASCLNIAGARERVSKHLREALTEQRAQILEIANTRNQHDVESPELLDCARAELQQALAKIEALEGEITRLKPQLLFGALPLTKINMYKLGGAVGAAFLSAVFRKVVSN
jgi:hypothetical protein